MWELLRENSRKIKVRVLHPLIPEGEEVEKFWAYPRDHSRRILYHVQKKMNQSSIVRKMESDSSGVAIVKPLFAFQFAYEFGDEKSTFLSQLGELYKTYTLIHLPSGYF